MDKEKLLEIIARGESVNESKELLEYLKGPAENAEEYIRSKNMWALLQTGSEMKSSDVQEDLQKVMRKVNKSVWKNPFVQILKYAAIIILALGGGYFYSQVNTGTQVAMNEVFVPRGNRTSVLLPDGTKVWISNGTRLVYPEQFNGDTRNVQLSGEGYFEVTHDPKHPFIVAAGEERIKVLGTKFAVVAYPEDESIKAELISGKIQFDIHIGDTGDQYRSYMVKPSHSLVYDKTSGKVYESIIPDGFYDYWKDGTYRFKNETFQSLAAKIERIYNVKIIFEDDGLKTSTFTGTLNIDDNIYTIMEVFKNASGKPFNYQYQRGKIFIKN